jgi:hypothetical protein
MPALGLPGFPGIMDILGWVGVADTPFDLL